MKFHKRTVAMAAALGFLFAPVAFAQTPAPAAPAAPRKLISPYRGDATVEFTKPVSKRNGANIVTTMTIKNTSPGAAGRIPARGKLVGQDRQPRRRRCVSPSAPVHAGRGHQRHVDDAVQHPDAEQQL